MPEKWAPIPSWPYEASTAGRVRSVDRQLADGRAAGGVILRPVADDDGYLFVTLSDGMHRWRVHVARLVLMAHARLPPSPEHQACHRNGRRGDCRLRNLYWGTRQENRADRERHRLARVARVARSKRAAEGGNK